MNENPLLGEFPAKIASLNPALQAKIIEEQTYKSSILTPMTNFLVQFKRHCNGGTTVKAGLWLKSHCQTGGKIFLTMSGAGSSFQQGKIISELIREGKIGAISVTGANLEESVYRLVANSCYRYIPDYVELTRDEEKELAKAGLRRITDTFLPEDESVRVILPALEKLWRRAETNGESFLWHEFFFQAFEEEFIPFDPSANPNDCWLLQAYLKGIPVFVPGWEDSTMGNIFTEYCYPGNHPFLSKYKRADPISISVAKPALCYMHTLAEWYMDNTTDKKLAFLQLGGGIAADFPICVVPHLKKDYLAEEDPAVQESAIPTWAGFVEIGSSPMSYGSYSGAGYKEKITWEKFEPDAVGFQIQGDYTEHFPDIAALVLGW